MMKLEEYVMVKFKDIQYKRPNLLNVASRFKKSMNRFTKAVHYEDARGAYLDVQGLVGDIETPYVIASIRNTMNMKDKFYEKEMKLYGILMALVAGLGIGAIKKLLNSGFRSDFEEEFGKQSFRLIESQIKTNGLKTVFEMIREDRLSSKYKKTVAACACEFRGETCNFYGLLKHMESPDRAERREAFNAWANLYEDAAPKLDNLYDKLVAVRVKKAKKLGFDNYIDYAYINRMRFDYTMQDTARFREEVRRHIVPLATELYEGQRKRLEVEKLRYFDERMFYPLGNPVPHGGKDEIVAAAGKMYAELSSETDEFFKFMTEYELFDLETRQNKHLGGYCTHMVRYKAPFIFSNFNGTSADVDVMTHEAGHAFQAYLSSRRQLLAEYISSTSEINEIHSMTMEHFTYPWMENFFGERADEYRHMHLAKSLLMIPYLVAVDEFQEEVYKRPKMGAAGRRQAWKDIEEKYMPWRDYDGNTFLGFGGFWMQKQHIFIYPFYYIEYALSQICAYQYFIRSLSDREAAWEDYLRLCEAGGSKGYFELLEIGKLKNPFADGTVKEVVADVKKELDKGAKTLGLG